jgi:hypothetical protein
MGVEATLTIALGGVSDAVRDLARAHAEAGEVAREFFGAVARASGSVAAWGIAGSKWLSDKAPSFEDLARELEAFVLEVHRANPDARFVASYETDHDDGDRAFWYERALPGPEEGGGGSRWERFDLACRIYPSAEPEEDDGLRAPRWSTRARHVWVLACGGRIAAGARAKSAVGRACLDGLASSGAWSPRAEDGAVDVLEIAQAVRGLGTVLVGYQPDSDRAKLARIDEKATHYDLPFGVVWSPALVAAGPRAAPEIGRAKGPVPLLESPLRPDALAKLENTPIQGMISEPVFRDLVDRTPAERRLLACDLAAKRPAPPVDQRASALVILLLEYSDVLEDGDAVAQLLACEAALPIGGLVAQLERFVAKGPLDEVAARAVLG